MSESSRVPRWSTAALVAIALLVALLDTAYHAGVLKVAVPGMAALAALLPAAW